LCILQGYVVSSSSLHPDQGISRCDDNLDGYSYTGVLLANGLFLTDCDGSNCSRFLGSTLCRRVTYISVSLFSLPFNGFHITIRF
jgi:hypothetical protein